MPTDPTPIPSPCTSVCRIDPANGLCEGCLRTRQEIAAWRDAGDAERLAILERLKARRRASGRLGAAGSRPRRRARVSAP